MIWDETLTWILFKFKSAVALMDAIMIKMIVISYGFCSHFSYYNKSQYKQISKGLILDAVYCEYNDSWRIGLYGLPSVSVGLYVVYLQKTEARLYSYDIY